MTHFPSGGDRGDSRIVVVIDALSARDGGGQTYLYNLLRHLPRDGLMDIHVLTLPGWPVDLAGIPVRSIVAPARCVNPVARAIWQRTRLPELLETLGADILFAPGGVTSATVPVGCKLVTMSRNLAPFDPVARSRYPIGRDWLRNQVLRILMLRSMERADLVIFVSEYAKALIQGLARKPLNSVLVIPHGVNEIFLRSENSESVRPEMARQRPYLLYVSSFEYYKAQVEVVRDFRQFLDVFGEDMDLLLVGRADTGYKRLVEREIGELGLVDRVVISGSVPYRDLPAIYKNARACIFASEIENCPNILLESMASGRPVFSSSNAPMPEFGGDSVVYFDPKSPGDLTAKLMATLKDAAKCESLGRAGVERASKYSWSESAGRTWRALYELAGASRKLAAKDA